MSEILSVEGQLVGIPVEKYTGVSGIVVDPVNKTITLDEHYYDGYNATSGGVLKALSNANIVVSTCHAIKVGNIISIYGAIDTNAAITIASHTWVNIGTVNDDLIPAHDVYIPFTVSNGSAECTGHFRIGTNGKLDLRQPTTINSYGRAFAATYRGA